MKEFIDICKNNDRVVFLPETNIDYLENLKALYGNCIIVMNDSFEYYVELIEAINSSKIKNLYFIDFMDIYRKIMPDINKNIIINDIILFNVANLTNPYTLAAFYGMYEFYERKIINNLFATDESMYAMLKKAKYNIKKLKMKSINIENKIKNNSKNKSIGILSTDYDPVHNFYNMLTAVTLVDNYDKVKLVSHMNATSNFLSYFNIKHKLCNDLDEVINDNFVNLYCNFTNTNPCIIMKSMDMGIPCIIGNTDIFDNNKVLKELLVLKSDDDVNEIADKINNIKDNYDKIFTEYRKWRN